MSKTTVKSKNVLVKGSARSAKNAKTQKTKTESKELNPKLPMEFISKTLSSLCNLDKKNPFARFWLFTVYDYNQKMENGFSKLDNLYKLMNIYRHMVRFIIFQGEICPTTKRKHIQGYIEFEDQVRRTKLQEITGCGKHWCQPRYAKTNNKVISYCCKPNEDWPAPEHDSFDYEANIRHHDGNSEVKQGKKKGLTVIIENLKNNKSLNESIEGNEETYIKHYNGIKNFQQLIDTPRKKTDPLEKECYFGAAGTGKSHKADTETPEGKLYTVPPSENSKWYPDYDNKKHTTVLYNDFNGSRMKRTTLLELLHIEILIFL
jgi:hypothetical protein